MGNTSFNPADASAAISLSNGNLTATATNSNNNAVRTLGGPQYSGKYYFEISADAIANNYAAFGIAGPGALLSTLWNTNAALAAIRFRAGSIYYNGVSGPFTGQMIGTGNVCGVAVDLDNGKIWFRHPDGNGWNGDGSAGEDPATNSGGGDISGFCRLGVWPCTLFAATGNVLTANFGDSAFAHSVPSGFTAGWPTNDNALHIDPAAVASALVYSAAAGAVTISTCGDERDVLLFVFSEKTNGAPTVVSVSDTAGLAWQRRQQYQFDASNKGDIEVWWAHAPSKLTGDVVTVTLSASTHNSVIAAVGIVNAASGLFDPNAGLPAAATGSTSPGAVTIDIDAGGENIAFGFWGSATSTLPGPGGGFTKLRGQTNSGGVGYGSVLLEGAHFEAGQDALTLDTAATGAVVWGMIADAVAAPDANAPLALTADLVEDAGFRGGDHDPRSAARIGRRIRRRGDAGADDWHLAAASSRRCLRRGRGIRGGNHGSAGAAPSGCGSRRRRGGCRLSDRRRRGLAARGRFRRRGGADRARDAACRDGALGRIHRRRRACGASDDRISAPRAADPGGRGAELVTQGENHGI